MPPFDPIPLGEAPWSMLDLAPGLLVAAAALGLDRLLRSLGDPIPWRAWAAFALLVALLLGGPLFAGKVLLPVDGLRGEVPFRRLAPTDPPGNPLQGDQLQLLLPAQAAAREGWREGRWPLRNERLGGPTPDLQVPVLGDPQSQSLQPLALLTQPLPLLAAPGALAALRLLCAFAFFFAFARRMELGAGAALVGACAWMLGGFTQLWLGWPIASTAALLPAALYAMSALDGAARRRHRAFAAAAWAALLLGGHPETIAYAVALVAAFGLATARGAARPLRWLVGTVAPSALLALTLAAPALVPAFAAGRLSERAAFGAAMPHPRDDLARRLVPIVAPNAFGNDRFVREDGVGYWGRHNINEDASGFAGTFALLAVLGSGAGWVLGRRGRGEWRWRRGERLILLAGLLSVAWIALPVPVRAAMVPASFEALLRVEEHRALLLVGFALAYGAACAVDRGRDAASRPRRALWVRLALAAGVGAVVFWSYRAHPLAADPTALAPLRDGWLSLQGKVLALSALYWLWAARERWAPAAAVFLVASELLVAHAPANPPAPRLRALPTTPALATLEEQGPRIAALGSALPSGLATLYGLADLRAYNPMAPAALRAALEPALAPGGGPPRFDAVYVSTLSRLGVTFVLTAPRLDLPGLVLAYDGPDARVWKIPAAASEPDAVEPDRLALAIGLVLCGLGIAAGAAALPPRLPLGLE